MKEYEVLVIIWPYLHTAHGSKTKNAFQAFPENPFRSYYLGTDPGCADMGVLPRQKGEKET